MPALLELRRSSLETTKTVILDNLSITVPRKNRPDPPIEKLMLQLVFAKG